MAQKLAPAKKNSRDISPVSPTFSISELTLDAEDKFPIMSDSPEGGWVAVI